MVRGKASPSVLPSNPHGQQGVECVRGRWYQWKQDCGPLRTSTSYQSDIGIPQKHAAPFQNRKHKERNERAVAIWRLVGPHIWCFLANSGESFTSQPRMRRSSLTSETHTNAFRNAVGLSMVGSSFWESKFRKHQVCIVRNFQA
jgi:hypothetical protein